MQLKRDPKGYSLRFGNGISLQLLKDGDDYGGIGAVRYKRRKLRSAALPMFPLIGTPDGYEVSRLSLDDVAEGAETVTLSLTPYVRQSGRTEWLCSDGQDRWNTDSWDGHEERDRGGNLEIKLRAVDLSVGDLTFAGFSYAYRFRSRKYSIYRIHDRATWELGGLATGNSFWMSGPFNPPRVTVRNKESVFTTAWHRDGRTIQQFLPLFSALQGFSFQFDRQNLLVTAFDAPCHCRSLFEKRRGSNHIVHWHQLCGDLGRLLEFPPLAVLCADSGNCNETDRANQFCMVRRHLQGIYRERTGVQAAPAVTAGRLTCGDGPPCIGVERMLDRLAGNACERVYVDGLVPAATSPSQPAAALGLPEFVAEVHGRGMEAAVTLGDCCSWPVDAGDGPADSDTGEAGVTCDRSLPICALRQDAALAAMLEHLRRLKQEVNVDVVYADSLLADITDDLDWGTLRGADGPSDRKGMPGSKQRGVRSLQQPRIELALALHKLGYCCLLAGAGFLTVPMPVPAGQVLDGDEFMFSDRALEFPYERLVEQERKPLEAYFRGCAHRLSYVVTLDGSRGAGMARWWHEGYAAINKAFHATRDYMDVARILPKDMGVLWSCAEPGTRVLWAFREGKEKVGPRTEVFDVMSSCRQDTSGGAFAVRPLAVYLIQDGE
jgi:hypothetical protein